VNIAGARPRGAESPTVSTVDPCRAAGLNRRRERVSAPRDGLREGAGAARPAVRDAAGAPARKGVLGVEAAPAHRHCTATRPHREASVT